MATDDRTYNLLSTESHSNYNSSSMYSGGQCSNAAAVGDCNSSVYIATQTSRMLFAAKKGDLAALQHMIPTVGVNACDYDKRTALHVACAEGKMVAVQLLLDCGADPNPVDRFGGTPLDDAVREGTHPEICHLLVSRGGMMKATNNSAREWELIQACGKGELDRARSLINANVDLQCSDYDLRTPLHLAAAEGRADVVAFLLSQGARIDAEDRWGNTPAMEAKLRAAGKDGDAVMKLLGPVSTGHAKMSKHMSGFLILMVFFECAICIMFGLLTKYGFGADTAVYEDDGLQAYWMDIHTMIFIGFGFLMCFLRRYGYSAVGYTLLISAFVMQWYTLCSGFWKCVFDGNWEKVELNRRTLMLADFCAGAVMITFGALIGKVSPLQLLLISLVEVNLYAINEQISLLLKITDIGGTMVIHMFGAYFGLACTWWVSPKAAYDDANNSSSYHADLFAMIGTVFLWLFWPSFNGGPGTGTTQQRGVVNTMYSLTGSCVMAFVTSALLRPHKKFNMVDVQNATLAGGVAMGTCADLILGNCGPAIAIGMIAGFVSVLGYCYIQPFLAQSIWLHDTCGVNNLHGMPSIIGAFAGVIAVAFASHDLYGASLGHSLPELAAENRTAGAQSGFQAAFIGITLAISLTGGFITGFLVKFPIFAKETLFLDSECWEVPETEIPFYFDSRGEISRGNASLVDLEQRLKELELWKLTSTPRASGLFRRAPANTPASPEVAFYAPSAAALPSSNLPVMGAIVV